MASRRLFAFSERFFSTAFIFFFICFRSNGSFGKAHFRAACIFPFAIFTMGRGASSTLAAAEAMMISLKIRVGSSHLGRGLSSLKTANNFL